MEKMREEFEAWYWNELYSDLNISSWGAIFGINRDGDYRGLECNTSWKAWQASRAALCVELPSFENGSIRGYSGDCEEARMVADAIAESLDEAGVSYE